MSQRVALIAGASVYVAASRGWLGWRVSGRARPVWLAIAVALFGGATLQFVVSGIRADGVLTFGIVWTAVAVGCAAVIHAIRTRWPTLGWTILAIVPMCTFVRGFASVLLNVAMPLVVVSSCGWMLVRSMRAN